MILFSNFYSIRIQYPILSFNSYFLKKNGVLRNLNTLYIKKLENEVKK
jgi:hypothetical protein